MVTLQARTHEMDAVSHVDPLYLIPFSVESLCQSGWESALVSCHVGDLTVNTSAGTKIEASLLHVGSP